MTSFLIKNARIIDSDKIFYADVLVKSGRFSLIAPQIDRLKFKYEEIDGEGKILIPGVIDVHVHFREPGLTHKADIHSESRAAAAGGVTSFIDMPNTIPQTTTLNTLREKFKTASKNSLINYSFYIGATYSNFSELIKAKEYGVAGIKLFLGSSTGNMLVDNEKIIEDIFSDINQLIVVHAEDESIIQPNLAKYMGQFGEDIPCEYHEKIRPAEACFAATLKAIGLALKYNTRLHLAHISTKDELTLLDGNIPLIHKKITAESGIQYLYFDSGDYKKLGTKIKCNPSIKGAEHKQALFQGLLNNKIDLIASDHAPHLIEEKNQPYTKCPSGIPLIQHSLPVMLEYYHNGKITIEKIVEKMCHAPAISHHIKERGFIGEDYHADFVMIDPDKKVKVGKENIYSKCNWSPFEMTEFSSSVMQTFINGTLVYNDGIFSDINAGDKIEFY